MEGRSNKEIARTLNLGVGTVKIHVAGLFRKLGVHRRAAVAVAGRIFAAGNWDRTAGNYPGNAARGLIVEGKHRRREIVAGEVSQMPPLDLCD